MEPVTLGLIGCGNISDAYLTGAANSKLVRFKACADLRPETAEAQAARYGIAALGIDQLLADPAIEIVINLTVPLAHAGVSLQVLEAGKHVYSEKPFAALLKDARAVAEAASSRNLRVGSAPDTFMGGAHQTCRRLIDGGRIGHVLAGSAAVISRGMESWHPNPDFFFKPGGGPILDVGPYYVTELINLLGPVTRVTSVATQGYPKRTIGSAGRRGEEIAVEVPTTVNGVLQFASGANVSLTASWDVWKNRRIPFELYGSEGSLLIPDPNFFGGTPEVTDRDGEWQPVDISAQPFGTPNRSLDDGKSVADYRMIGVFDMAAAIRAGRPHRANGDLALHALEVMEAFGRSSAEGRHIAIESTCARPEPVPEGTGEEVFLQG
ncbi:Predicted dehydrogenase [Faunimonas pinastri]|uniref:Predicted dehydrogenase n=1 Tax=Faunimonas pinastri TaxID=1855383 RepID=A0A1H9IF61_9HYPH|nr:Gfo/Idh/MocA family oxidoreductase [Faunimonas pinastri]SEQ73194.1 Predicted dehydrogenase [Faunimonas pinastri]